MTALMCCDMLMFFTVNVYFPVNSLLAFC